VDKSDTCLCEPADYLAYACTQLARNQNTVKSRWTYPILSVHAKLGAGIAFQRDQIRNVILGEKVARLREMIQMVKIILEDNSAPLEKDEDTAEPSI